MILPSDSSRPAFRASVPRLLDPDLLKEQGPVSFPTDLVPPSLLLQNSPKLEDRYQSEKGVSGQARPTLNLFERPMGSLYLPQELAEMKIPRAIPIDEETLLPLPNLPETQAPIPRAIPIDEETLLPIAESVKPVPPPSQLPPAKPSSPPSQPVSEPSTTPEPRYQKSPYHDPKKFVPTFPMMAYHESGIYRNRKDPYGVGAITYPSRKQDSGGKTYGTYQFETYVYKNGTRGSAAKVANSTMMRFLKWDKNPFAAELNAVVKRYGVASSQFDQAWKKLASEQNLALGKAQEAFVLHDKKSKVDAFLAEAQLSEDVKQDPRIFDLVLGTLNHVDSLATPIPKLLARKQREAGRKLSADEVGKIITTFKGTQISNWFISSPKAHKGIRDRFKSEGRVFA